MRRSTDSSEFRKACLWGFDAYFEGMYEWESSGGTLVFVPRLHTWVEVVELVVETALCEDWAGYQISRGGRAGFGLGWLSALALVNRQEAMVGLTMLMALIVGPAADRMSVVSWHGVGGALC